jgi:hypothetical protein
MDKGIRVNVNNKFAELLPQLATMGGKAFRAAVRGYAIEEFGITGAAASTHYNFAKQEAAKVPELAAFMEGLGRAPEKNNGGRKRKVAVEVVEVPEQTVFAVYKKGCGELVAEGLSFEDATALVAKAKAAKKATLYWV